MGLMAGAIVSHLFILGIVVMDDGGLLFTYALIAVLLRYILYGLRVSI